MSWLAFPIKFGGDVVNKQRRNEMNVRELIEILEEFDIESEVKIQINKGDEIHKTLREVSWDVMDYEDEDEPFIVITSW